MEAAEFEGQYLSTSYEWSLEGTAEILTRIIGMLQWTMTIQGTVTKVTFLACHCEPQSYNRVLHSNAARMISSTIDNRALHF